MEELLGLQFRAQPRDLGFRLVAAALSELQIRLGTPHPGNRRTRVRLELGGFLAPTFRLFDGLVGRLTQSIDLFGLAFQLHFDRAQFLLEALLGGRQLGPEVLQLPVARREALPRLLRVALRPLRLCQRGTELVGLARGRGSPSLGLGERRPKRLRGGQRALELGALPRGSRTLVLRLGLQSGVRGLSRFHLSAQARLALLTILQGAPQPSELLLELRPSSSGLLFAILPLPIGCSSGPQALLELAHTKLLPCQLGMQVLQVSLQLCCALPNLARKCGPAIGLGGQRRMFRGEGVELLLQTAAPRVGSLPGRLQLLQRRRLPAELGARGALLRHESVDLRREVLPLRREAVQVALEAATLGAGLRLQLRLLGRTPRDLGLVCPLPLF
mmetsp:Transcript_41981/g.135813  ORF Transcript_41981/g.135813 Transcript_41981/m.135813 type:complete len:387 (-) Transcript_41981:1541-2701(-)